MTACPLVRTAAPIIPAPKPGCVDRGIFADAGSIGHLAIGWFAGRIPATHAIAILTLFAGYQLSQAGAGEEPLSRVASELAEFAFGMLLAQL